MNASVNVTKTLPITDPSKPLPIGQSAYDGKGNLTVTDVSFKDKMSDPTPSFAIGKQYLIVGITYENLQKNATLDADLSLMKVTDGGGYAFEPVSDIMLENPYTGKTIGPLEKRTGNLLFIVPPQATYLKLHYTSQNQTGRNLPVNLIFSHLFSRYPFSRWREDTVPPAWYPRWRRKTK